MPTRPTAPTAILPSAYHSGYAAWDEIVFETELFGILEFPVDSFADRYKTTTENGVAVFGDHGKVKVDVKLGRDLETKKAPGKNVHRVIDRGLKRAEITIELTTWTQAGLSQMTKLISSFELRARLKDRKAIKVTHPAINVYDLHEIVVRDAHGPHPGDMPGAFVLEITAIDWRPPAQARHHRSQTVRTVALPNAVVDTYGGGVTNSSTAAGRSDRNLNFTPNLNP
jgi:hypothetical protein